MSIVTSIKTEFNRRLYKENVWRIERVLDMISEDEVWYKPNSSANSIGHLILHLCGNVTQWIGSGVGKMEDLRQRDLEFSTEERVTKEELIRRLHTLRGVTDDALSQLEKDSDLMLPRAVQGYDETVLSILIHVIEHFSYHTGQIALIVKYLHGRDLGFYAGHDLNAKS